MADKDKNPIVSVVIPTYNYGQFVGDAIKSVLNQTFDNLELIIVDNYSQDQTEEVVSSFKDERIQYYKFANHGVIAASRNFGIQKARGTYISFLDSDDYWLETKLEKQVSALDADEKRGLSFARVEAVRSGDREERILCGPKADELPEEIYDRLIKVNFIVSSSVMVRASVLEKAGLFDESKELVCSEDFDFWLRIARFCEQAFVPEVLGICRFHGNNESDNGLRLQKALAVIDKHERKGWASSDLARQARASFYFQVGWTSIGEDPKLARSHFKKSRELNSGNLRVASVCMIGWLLSFVPAFYVFLRSKKIDQAISRKTIHSQNL